VGFFSVKPNGSRNRPKRDASSNPTGFPATAIDLTEKNPPATTNQTVSKQETAYVKERKMRKPTVSIETAVDAVNIEIHEDTVERMSGMSGGPTVADITVNHSDGTMSRFFVGIKMVKGRAKAEIACNGPGPHESVKKSIVGHKRPSK
jgi:hypothetical protein